MSPHQLHYLFRCALRELLRRKTRTVGTVLGYAIAMVAAMILTVTLYSSRTASDQILKHTGTHFMTFQSGCGTRTCGGVYLIDNNDGFEVNGVQAMPLSDGDADAVKRMSSVKDASLLLSFRFYDPATQTSVTIAGFDPRNNEAVGTTCCAAGDIRSGRFISVADSSAVLLHESFAQLRRLGAGDSIIISSMRCVVAGVVNPGIRPARADVYMNIAAARALVQTRIAGMTMKGRGNAILVETKNALMHDSALKELERAGFQTSTYKCYLPAAKVIGMNRSALVVLLVMIALMTILFVVKTQVGSVIERQREIAILRAVGWSASRIVTMLMMEAGIPAGCGWGAGFGAALVYMAVAPKSGAFAGLGLVSGALAGASILMCLCGVAAGGIAAVLAIRMKPAEGLRRL